MKVGDGATRARSTRSRRSPLKEASRSSRRSKLDGQKRGDRRRRSSRRSSTRLQFLNNVGLDYLSLDRSAETLSGGEAQRIRLASQIGSGLTGVMYVLDEPSIGLHQRDNDRLLDDAEAPARPRQQRDRRRARRGRDPRRRPRRRHGPRRRRARRRRSSRRARPRRSARAPHSLTGQYLAGHAPDPDARAAAPRRRRAHADASPARRGNNLKNVDARSSRSACSSASPACRARASRRSSTTRCTTRSRGTCTAAPTEPAPHDDDRGPRALRQGDQRRPEPDRPHAALESGDVHGPVHADPRAVRAGAGVARARLRPGPLLVQRQGRALRGVPGRRPHQGRDALPARRLRAVRRVPRPALQPRDARDPLQGQEHPRGARR